MKIAILSRNSHLYSTRRLVEAAEAAGHEAHVIDHLKCNIEIEQKGPSLYYGSEYLEGFDAVIPRVGASVTFYGTAVVRQFEMMNVYCLNNAAAIGRARDKLNSLQLLARDGLQAEQQRLLARFHVQQAEQIRAYRAAWKEAGHAREPRVSVSRSIFALVNDMDRAYFGQSAKDQDSIGFIDDNRPGSVDLVILR